MQRTLAACLYILITMNCGSNYAEDYGFELRVKSIKCEKLSSGEDDAQDEIYLAVTAGKIIMRTQDTVPFKEDSEKKNIVVFDHPISNGGQLEFLFHVREVDDKSIKVKADFVIAKIDEEIKVGENHRNIGDIRLVFRRDGDSLHGVWRGNDTNYTEYKGGNVAIFKGSDAIYTVVFQPIMTVRGKPVEAVIANP